MTERGSSVPPEPADETSGGARHLSTPSGRDPSLELFGGTGADDERAAISRAYTGRHRAPDA